MSVSAVIFDLFGTLVTYPPGAMHVRLMAEKVGTEPERLHPIWRRLRPERDGGRLDTGAALRICCEELGLHATDDAIDSACTAVAAFFRDLLVPRRGALETITRLRDRGLRIGLVSDANMEVSRAWPSCAFADVVQAAVFSCDEHVRKPDSALYRAVCDRLGVAAADCLYVGNGDGDELSGATRFGMRAVLFTAEGELPGREGATWPAERITTLTEIIELV